MGHLDRLESTSAPATTLFTFSTKVPEGNRGWDRRNATFTIANTPFGTSPFLSSGAPFAPRQWKWKARFIPHIYGMSGDAIVDAVNRAMDLGREVRLVYITDDGYERVCDGIAYNLDAPINADSTYYSLDMTVTFELLSPWGERFVVNADQECGNGFDCGEIIGGSVISCGSSSSVAVSSTAFTVPSTMCDGTVAGPGGIPTYTDTTSLMRFGGPIGGDGGFTVANSAGTGSLMTVKIKLLTGDLLVTDFGAKDYLLTRGGVTTDVSPFITTDRSHGYDFAVFTGVLNPITITALGANPTSGGSFVAQWNRLFS